MGWLVSEACLALASFFSSLATRASALVAADVAAFAFAFHLSALDSAAFCPARTRFNSARSSLTSDFEIVLLSGFAFFVVFADFLAMVAPSAGVGTVSRTEVDGPTRLRRLR